MVNLGQNWSVWSSKFSQDCGTIFATEMCGFGMLRKCGRLEGLRIFANHPVCSPSFASNCAGWSHTRKWRKSDHRFLRLEEASQQKPLSTWRKSSPARVRFSWGPSIPPPLGGFERHNPTLCTTSLSSASASDGSAGLQHLEGNTAAAASHSDSSAAAASKHRRARPADQRRPAATAGRCKAGPYAVRGFQVGDQTQH